MNKRLKLIPKFASEAAERAFWEKNDSTVYMDWKKAQVAVLPNLKPSTQTISLRLPQHLLDYKVSCQRARCTISISDQGVVAGEAAGIVNGEERFGTLVTK